MKNIIRSEIKIIYQQNRSIVQENPAKKNFDYSAKTIIFMGEILISHDAD